jgi:HD domain
MCIVKLRNLVNRRAFLNVSATTACAIAANSSLSTRAVGKPADESPTFRRPKTIIPVPTPSAEFQHVTAGVPDTKMTREATGLLREFSKPVLINHSHRCFFWANEMGRQTGQKFDVELLFVCAAFHDFGLLKKFSSSDDRFEVDGANAVRQFLEHHGVPNARIQTASHHARHRSIQAVRSGAPIQWRRTGFPRRRVRNISRRRSQQGP